MKHDIIKTDNYLLIVSDDKINQGDYYIDFRSDGLKIEHFKTKDDWVLVGICGSKKIIAHLPLNNSPILEGVDLLPPLEDEVETLCNQHGEKVWGEYKNDVFEHHNIITDKTLCEITTFDFKSGYNKAKEKYKFTEEDIMSAMKRAVKYYSHMWDDSDGEKIIQSLQQPKMPVGFECEMDIKCWCMKPENGGCAECNQKPKTTTNSQGQTVWVGKYIFND